MAKLADLDVSKCPECGKIFSRRHGKQLCSDCAEIAGHGSSPAELPPAPLERQRIDEISLLMGLPREEVEYVLRVARENGAVLSGGRTCARCRVRSSMSESDLCINCKVELYRSLGEAADDLFDEMEYLTEETGSPSVVLAYREKRERTATSRINPVGAKRLKY